MRTVSFNIWDLPLWFVLHRNERSARLVTYLRDLDAEVVCLQESFDPAHRSILNARLVEAGYHTSDPEPQKRQFFFTTLDATGGLVTFSKFPIRKTTFIPFSRFHFSPLEFFSRKGMLITLLETPYGMLRVVNTHLHHQSMFFARAVRLRQIRAMMAYLDQDISCPTILAGDFNEDGIVEPGNFLGILAREQFLHAGPESLAFSYRKENPYVTIWMNRISDSKRLDYIFHRNLAPLGIVPDAYAVLTPPNAISDHDPVLLSLRRP